MRSLTRIEIVAEELPISHFLHVLHLPNLSRATVFCTNNVQRDTVLESEISDRLAMILNACGVSSQATTSARIPWDTLIIQGGHRKDIKFTCHKRYFDPGIGWRNGPPSFAWTLVDAMPRSDPLPFLIGLIGVPSLQILDIQIATEPPAVNGINWTSFLGRHPFIRTLKLSSIHRRHAQAIVAALGSPGSVNEIGLTDAQRSSREADWTTTDVIDSLPLPELERLFMEGIFFAASSTSGPRSCELFSQLEDVLIHRWNCNAPLSLLHLSQCLDAVSLVRRTHFWNK